MTQKQRSTIPRATSFEIRRKLELWYYGPEGFTTRTYMGHEANELYGKSYKEVYERVKADPDLRQLEGVADMASSIMENLARAANLYEWKHKCYPRKIDAEAHIDLLNGWLEENTESVFKLLRPQLDEWFKEKVSIKSLMEEDWGEGPQ